MAASHRKLETARRDPPWSPWREHPHPEFRLRAFRTAGESLSAVVRHRPPAVICGNSHGKLTGVLGLKPRTDSPAPPLGLPTAPCISRSESFFPGQAPDTSECESRILAALRLSLDHIQQCRFCRSPWSLLRWEGPRPAVRGDRAARTRTGPIPAIGAAGLPARRTPGAVSLPRSTPCY